MHVDLYGAVRLSKVREIIQTEVAGETELASSGSRNWWGAGSLICTFLAASLLYVLLTWPNASPQESAFADSWPGAIATISRVEGVTWTEGSRQFAIGDFVSSGEALEFESGLLEIEFRQGAVAVLQGPAHLIAIGANHATLQRGDLAAFAPPWAVGFRVDTPSISVIDHGTRFAINVQASNQDAEVKVLVAEGEVEVLQSNEQQGHRLFAGQGVRSQRGVIKEHNIDASATLLTNKLPTPNKYEGGVVVGDRWHDWQPGTANQPNRSGQWRYFTNIDGAFGDPGSYKEMCWETSVTSHGCFRPTIAERKRSQQALRHVRVHREGGHPGRGKSQSSDGLDHYSITGFIIPEEGSYRIQAGWLERPEPRRWDLDHVLDVAIHVNDGPIVLREFCNRDCFVKFQGPLGTLKKGDVVYAGVGPSGTNHNDRFRWGFYIVRDPSDLAAELTTREPESQ